MALVKCPDCGKKVSDLAPACVSCGRPLSTISQPKEPVIEQRDPKTDLKSIDSGNPEIVGLSEKEMEIFYSGTSPIPKDKEYRTKPRPPQGMKWAKLWIWGVLPLQGGFWLIFSVLLFLEAIFIGEDIFESAFSIPAIVLSALFGVALISASVGLYKRKMWAWKSNIFFLAFGLAIAMSFNLAQSYDAYSKVFEVGKTPVAKVFAEAVGKTSGFFLFWIVPNYLYWKKRKHPFLPSRLTPAGASPCPPDGLSPPHS